MCDELDLKDPPSLEILDVEVLGGGLMGNRGGGLTFEVGVVCVWMRYVAISTVVVLPVAAL
jgi:hypothetical protein